MYTIKFKNAIDDYYWSSGDWKDYVRPDFDENVVLVGNKDYAAVEEAYWWGNAQSVCREFDYANDEEEFVSNAYDELARTANIPVLDVENKLHQAWQMYLEADSVDNDFIFDIACLLHNEIPLESYTIRGNVQGDWQDVYYVDDGMLDLAVLSDWYFGNVMDILAVDEDDDAYSAAATDSQLYTISKLSEEDQKTALADLLGISFTEIGDINWPD